jgi:hypothetical protein
VQPADLIETARLLANSGKKPRQADLRRAVSTAYYAMFHCLARSRADTLVGSVGAIRSKPAWHQTYRALEHAYAKDCCKNSSMMAKFPQGIQDYANTFISMQAKRHSADYALGDKFYRSATVQDIEDAETAILGFGASPIKDRRAFAAYVLLRRRPN